MLSTITRYRSCVILDFGDFFLFFCWIAFIVVDFGDFDKFIVVGFVLSF